MNVADKTTAELERIAHGRFTAPNTRAACFDELARRDGRDTAGTAFLSPAKAGKQTFTRI
jgi:hypothetical protein